MAEVQLPSLCLLLSPPLPYLVADEKSIESLPLFFSVCDGSSFFKIFPLSVFGSLCLICRGTGCCLVQLCDFFFMDTFSVILMISRVSPQPP